MKNYEIKTREIIENGIKQGYEITLLVNEQVKEQVFKTSINETLHTLCEKESEWYEKYKIDTRVDNLEIKVEINE